jgi:hypothetical protein
LLGAPYLLPGHVQSVVDSIMANNQPPIPSDKVLGFPSRSLADNYLLAHPDGAMGAVHFTRFNDSSVGYIIQSNSTVRAGQPACSCIRRLLP